MSRTSSPGRPSPAPVDAAGIPDALQGIPRWVVWRYVEEADNETGEVDYDKPPVNARTGGLASSTNPQTWCTFAEALAAYGRGKLDGIGFVLHRPKREDGKEESGGLVGVDLDDCRDPATGEIQPWALEIIRELDSYTEVSPSGAGVRLFLYGDLPPHGRKKGAFENYQSGRYVTVTGNHIDGTPLAIERRQEQLLGVHTRIFGGGKGPAKPGPRPDAAPASLDDAELIRKATGARGGDKFSRLWRGEVAGHNSGSEADLALCNYLAFWCGPDEGRIADLFAQSGLFRSKWKRDDYRKRTIAKALEGRTAFYDPARRSSNGASGNGHNGRTDAARPQEVDADGQGDGAADRAEVLITTEQWAVNDAVVVALPRSAHLFQRGNLLATVLRPPPEKGRLMRPAGSPVIAPLPPPRLREEMTRVVCFVKETRSRGKIVRVRAHPPDWCVSAVHARGGWPGVRRLEAVVETPVLRPDGTVLDRPGYDPDTGLLYEPAADFPPVAGRPGLADALESANRLLRLVADFPFVGESHRAAWLAALLTPFARFALGGPCPLFLMESGAPGTGKSLLCDVVAVLATGREMARTSFPDRDDELRKAITAVALAGDRLILFDNVTGAFGGAALDAALTGTTWKDRILGRSEMTADIPLLAVWYATGNNVTLRGDARRRAVLCRIEATDERPEERQGFQIPCLLEHVRANRGALVADCLTVLRAYEAAGRPDRGLTPLGSFERWSDLVRAAVHWVRGVDACETRDGLQAADSAVADLAMLLRGWAELPGGTEGLTAAEALRLVREAPTQYEALREVFHDWSRRGKGNDLPSAKTIGRRLLVFRGRVSGGRSLKSTLDRDSVSCWSVTAVK